MKLCIIVGVILLVGCVLSQNVNQRWEERAKLRAERQKLRQQRREERLRNAYRWTLVLDDQAQTEVQQRAHPNPDSLTINFWSADIALANAGYNSTIMMQDNAGLVAVIPIPGRSPLFPFNSQLGTGAGRGRFAGRFPGQGRRGGLGQGIGRGQGRGLGQGFGPGQGLGLGQGRGLGQGLGLGGRNGFGFNRGAEPCYIIPAQMTYAETLSKLSVNNATGKFDIGAEILDYVTAMFPMTSDMRTNFVTEHADLARFCGQRPIFDAQTVTTGTDATIDKMVNAVSVWGHLKIRIKNA